MARRTLRIRRLSRSCPGQTGAEIIEFRSLRHPIVVRLGTDDLPALINNAVRQEWGQLPAHYKPEVIIDAGAYIGDTSAYFLSRFPGARVVALEPNPASFKQAERNLLAYGERVTLLQAALWDEITTVHISGQGTGAAVSARGCEFSLKQFHRFWCRFPPSFRRHSKAGYRGCRVQSRSQPLCRAAA